MNYLKINNFGPVKDATIELKSLVVLIGGQGTGKSTIAKLLTIFQDYLWYDSEGLLDGFQTRCCLFYRWRRGRTHYR